ncbi:hypothetical protein AAG906_023592 [Vitis piasezkii]
MNEYLLKICGFVDLLVLIGARIEKYDKSLNSETASINITQGLGNFGRDNFSQGRGFTSNNQFSPNFGISNFSPRGRGGFQGRGGFNNAGQRSWNTWNNNATANAEKLVCQVCMKFGHFTVRCYYKYDPSFKGHLKHSVNCQVSVHVSDFKPQYGSSTISLWHDKLGHPSFKIVQTVMSLCKLSKFNKILPDSRKHGHIVEEGLTLLARASMPFKYWDESFKIVVFLHNDCLSSFTVNHRQFFLLQPASSISTTSSPTPFALIPHVNTATHLENCQDSNAPIVSSSIPNTVVNTHSMVTRSKKDIFKPKVYTLQNENWKITMIGEYSTLLRNNTWSLVDLLDGRKVTRCKWVFKVKENSDGSINKYKARIITKDLQEEVYMEQPKGFIEKSTSHLAPRAWFEKLYEALIGLGFTSAKSYQSLFTRFTMDHTTFLLVYVDDILVTSSNPCVKHTTKGLHLSQTKYVHDLLCKAKMNNENGINTPMISG